VKWPIPDVLLADCGGADFERPYLVYRWIDGIMLNECRRQTPPAALLSVAESLGRLLAGVASFSFTDDLNGAPNDVHEGQSPMEVLLSANEEALLHGLARKRLDAALADAMWSRLDASAVRLRELEHAASLVHGDLGAQHGHVLQLVVKQGISLALAGVGIGLLATFGLTSLISGLLFGVSATDLLTFVTIGMLLMFVAVLACWVPARRATKVDPMIALRCE